MIKVDWKRWWEDWWHSRVIFGYMRLWGYNSAKGWVAKWVKVK